MSSPCRCVGAIIARLIAVAMKPHGGKTLALIQLSPPVHYGLRRIRYRELPAKWATKARPPWPQSAPMEELSVIGGSPNEARMTKKRSQLSRLALNDFLQADRGEPSQCSQHVRHALAAETVIGALEDAEDYKAFEAAIIADYDAQTAVERELVLRLDDRLP